MATEIKPLDQILKELPQESQAEVRAFVESLIEKRKRQTVRHLHQTWAGALEDYREQFTSLELQKKSPDWRGEGWISTPGVRTRT